MAKLAAMLFPTDPADEQPRSARRGAKERAGQSGSPEPTHEPAKAPDPGRPRVFLVDGTALAFRSHFAMLRSGLTAPDGRPTGATFGFTTALRRILDEGRPDLMAVAFDHKSPTFRHARYAEYKATRERAPEELLQQMETLRTVVRAHGLPLFEVPGYEADDVIGTLALEAARRECDVFIVTGDKDFLQLVGERIRLYNIFRRDDPEPAIEGPETARAKFGTDPAHVIDVLAVMGDASDNVPGVHGIGEKGAIELIGRFGSVTGLLEHLAEVPEKTRAKIERDREQLLLSRDLVRIDTAVPLAAGFEALKRPEPDAAALAQLFTALDFRSLLPALTAPRASPGEREYALVQERAALADMLGELRGAGGFALALQTTSSPAPTAVDAELVGLAFACRAEHGWYVPLDAAPRLFPAATPAESRDLLLAELASVLCDRTLLRVGHDTKLALLVLRRQGLHPPPPSFDTLVASFCAAGALRRHDLESLVRYWFNLQKTTETELLGTGKGRLDARAVPVEALSAFACEEADSTWRLHAVLKKDLAEHGATRLFRELELPLVPVLAGMEERGIRVDTALLATISAEVQADMEAAARDVQTLAGRSFNVNSTKVLGQILFEELRIQDQAGVKRPKKTKTGWSTDADTLAEKYGAVPIVRRLLEYRELSKLVGTYLEALPRYVNARTGRVHCSFSQVSAATGRLASSDPNLQNIPVRTARGRRLRAAFVPRDADEHGRWLMLSADYSQIELRVMAHLSKDEGLLAAFAAGQDIHAATAARVFDVAPALVTRELRSQAKVINFGLLYGMGPTRVARETGMSLADSRAFIERYFASFPRVREWIDALLAAAKKQGYVETLSGRRRHVPEIHSQDGRLAAGAENAAVNTPVQGSAADIIKRAMIDLDAALERAGLAGRILLQVHDELLLEVPERELAETTALVRRCMEGAAELAVPLQVDIGSGPSWLEAH